LFIFYGPGDDIDLLVVVRKLTESKFNSAQWMKVEAPDPRSD